MGQFKFPASQLRLQHQTEQSNSVSVSKTDVYDTRGVCACRRLHV